MRCSNRSGCFLLAGMFLESMLTNTSVVTDTNLQPLTQLCYAIYFSETIGFCPVVRPWLMTWNEICHTLCIFSLFVLFLDIYFRYSLWYSFIYYKCFEMVLRFISLGADSILHFCVIEISIMPYNNCATTMATTTMAARIPTNCPISMKDCKSLNHSKASRQMGTAPLHNKNQIGHLLVMEKTGKMKCWLEVN